MSKTLMLFKTMFKSEDIMELGAGRTGGKIKGIFKVLGLMLVLLLAGISFTPIIIELYKPLQSLGMADLLLRLLLFGASMLVLFFAFFYIMSVFYFSSDIENYLYLPIKPGSIVLSKFFVVMFYEIITTFVLFYPSIVAFGYMDGQNFGFYIKALVAIILLPIVPLVIMAILCMILMRFSKLFRNKDRFTMVSTLIAIGAALSVNGLMQRLGTTIDGSLPALVQSSGPLFNVLSIIFPTVTLMNQALVGGLKDLVIYLPLTLLISGVAIFLFYQVGNVLFIDGAKGLTESGMRRKELSTKEWSTSTKANHAVLAIAGKELKLLLRTPVYFLNCILLSLILPLFIIFPMLLSGSINEILAELKILNLDEIRGLIPPDLIVIAIVAVMVFYSGLNLISATAISREGSNFSFMKYIPVPYRTQLLAKMLPAFLVQFIGLSIILIPLSILVQPPLYSIGLGLILGGLFSLLMNLLMISIDVMKPVLNWTSEQRAVKQNFNGVISSMLSIAFAAVPVLLFFFVKIDAKLLFGGMFIILLAATLGMIVVLPAIAEKSFRKRP